MCVTFKHANMHSIVSSLGDAEHDVQTLLDLSFALLTARQQLLHKHMVSMYLEV